MITTENLAKFIEKEGDRIVNESGGIEIRLNLGELPWQIAVKDSILHFYHPKEELHLEIGITDREVIEFHERGRSSYTRKVFLPNMIKERPWWLMGFSKEQNA